MTKEIELKRLPIEGLEIKKKGGDKMAFSELLNADRLLKRRKWSMLARRAYLKAIKDEPICPVCGAVKLVWLEVFNEVHHCPLSAEKSNVKT